MVGAATPDQRPTGGGAGADPALIGRALGAYRIVRLIGEGGMGAVYLAEHPAIGSKVAIKVLHREHSADRRVVDRFFNEARAVNLIGHDNIVQVLDYSETGDGRYYCVMELLQGRALEALLRRHRPLHLRVAGPIFLQCCRALQAAHERGIIHRDLKPENVFLARRGDRDHFVKVLDFGIAKLVTTEVASVTKPGMVIGTPAYMSPEQAAGDVHLISPRSDVYSLGVVMYQAATGRIPFSRPDGSLGAMLMAHMREAPAPPRSIEPSMPEAYERLVLRCLEKEPRERFGSMAGLGEALEGCLRGLGISGDLPRPEEVAGLDPPPDEPISPDEPTAPASGFQSPVAGLAAPPPAARGGAGGTVPDAERGATPLDRRGPGADRSGTREPAPLAHRPAAPERPPSPAPVADPQPPARRPARAAPWLGAGLAVLGLVAAVVSFGRRAPAPAPVPRPASAEPARAPAAPSTPAPTVAAAPPAAGSEGPRRPPASAPAAPAPAATGATERPGKRTAQRTRDNLPTPKRTPDPGAVQGAAGAAASVARPAAAPAPTGPAQPAAAREGTPAVPGPPEPVPTTPPAAGPPASAPAAPSAPADRAAAPPSPTAAAPSALVKLLLVSKPNASVEATWRGGSVRSQTPGAIEVPRGAAVRLVFTAEGHAPHTVELEAAAQRAVTATLQPLQ